MEISEAEITDYLDVETRMPKRVDLIFSFGTRNSQPAFKAAMLLNTGISEKIVLTGGINKFTGLVEAHRHREILLQHNISEGRIIVEDKSSNTLENVVFAIPLIENRLELDKLKSMLVITKWYHSRRALMTIKRFFPAGLSYYTVTYEPDNLRKCDWWKNPESHSRIMREFSSISRYLARGHLQEIKPDSGAYI